MFCRTTLREHKQGQHRRSEFPPSDPRTPFPRFAIIPMFRFPILKYPTHLGASPAATGCSQASLSLRLLAQRAKAPFPPPCATAANGLKRSPSARKRLLELGGGIPQAVKDKPPADDRGLLPIFLRFAPCRLVPSAPSVLDCFPPFHVWAFVPPAAEKCACCFSSNRGVLSNFTDTESRQPPCATPNRGGAASIA